MSDVDLNQLVAAAFRLQCIWEDQGLGFCFIGGLAVQHWGEPRLTNDVDGTVWTEFGNERPIVKRLLENLSPRIDEAVEFAIANRVLLAQESSGIDIDVSLAAFPFERKLIDSSQKRLFVGGVPLRICEASDLVVLKAFANRPRDWIDIRGILIRSHRELDWRQIQNDVTMLANLKEEPEIWETLEDLRNRLT